MTGSSALSASDARVDALLYGRMLVFVGGLHKSGTTLVAPCQSGLRRADSAPLEASRRGRKS
jgi:hypothetical protein